MGIDLKAGGRRVGHKSSMKVVKTQNPYNKLLIKLYKFLSRRTDSKFCATVTKRLHMSKVNQPPMGLHRLSKYMSKKDGKTAVIVGKVTQRCQSVHWHLRKRHESASRPLVESASLWISSHFVHPREPTRCCSVGPSHASHWRTLDTRHRSTTRTRTPTSSRTCEARDASSKRPAVAVARAVSRSKTTTYSKGHQTIMITSSVVLRLFTSVS